MKPQKTWFITGAARGFGFEITKAVLASGDNVVATVRSRVEEFSAQFNKDPNLLVVTMDVTNEQQVRGPFNRPLIDFTRLMYWSIMPVMDCCRALRKRPTKR
ncbi:SDR family NAD(P)-dependent oxidoreductase [Spirosoma sp. KNUC1025]|uniref:SDR family NAD(P)-dependent oxidoreductase n=1 Tax=Spirosoma sp. KNUC1025 TaxID=2894082 RepID=UPI00386B8046